LGRTLLMEEDEFRNRRGGLNPISSLVVDPLDLHNTSPPSALTKRIVGMADMVDSIRYRVLFRVLLINPILFVYVVIILCNI
jgi:uncharacterized phosphosugar-binding protein